MSEAANPVDVRFGCGMFEESIEQIFERGRVTIITTRGTRTRFLDTLLAKKRLTPDAILDSCIENPTFDSCAALHHEIDFARADQLLAIGGGSVLDAAKAVSVHAGAGGFESVEAAVRRGEGLDGFELLPITAVPTTAGTGSEVTCWGSIWDDRGLEKYSISDLRLYPALAICDPTLTLTLPRETTVATALDALSHAFESIWNRNATKASRGDALAAIDLILTHLLPLTRDLANLELRTKLMRAALRAGLAFSQTKTSVAHALSYYLTLRKDVPHGRACSFSLPWILRVYLGEHGGGTLDETHLERLEALFEALEISTRPADYGVSEAEFDTFFEAATRSERMRNGVVDLTRLRSELAASY